MKGVCRHLSQGVSQQARQTDTFLNCLNCHQSIVPAIKLAIRSENRHTYPDSQLSVELWKNQQTRYQDKNLAGDRQNIALLAMPILWKKLEVTIWKPTIGKNITTIRSPLAEMRTSSSCVVKIETASRGINIPIRKPVVVTMVAA